MPDFFHTYLMFATKLTIAIITALVFLKFFSMKNQLKQMTPLDIILNFILSAILSSYVLNNSISLGEFLGIMAIYAVLMYLVSRFTFDTSIGRSIFVGTPKVIIRDGECDIHMMKKMKVSARDIAAVLRRQKIHSISDVKSAQIEPNGDLTVVKNGEENYSLVVIDNGVIVQDALARLGKNEAWLKRKLRSMNVKSYKDVFIAQWGKDGLEIIKSN